MAKLSQKQKLFVQNYLVTLNSADAARKANYSEKTARTIGSELLTKPDIQEAIQKATEKRNERVQVDQDWVLKKSIVMVNGCMTTRTDADGNESFNDAANANKALDRIGKHTGGFRESVDIQGDISINVNTGMKGTPGSEAE